MATAFPQACLRFLVPTVRVGRSRRGTDFRADLVQPPERGSGLLEGSNWTFPRSHPAQSWGGGETVPQPLAPSGARLSTSPHPTPPRPGLRNAPATLVFIWPPRPQQPGSVRNPTPPSAAAKPAPARTTPRGRAGRVGRRALRQPLGHGGGRVRARLRVPAPRPRAVPGTKGPLRPSPQQAARAAPRARTRAPPPPPIGCSSTSSSLLLPTRRDSAGAPRDLRGPGLAARTGSVIGSPGRSQPRLPPVPSPEGGEIGMRGKGERSRWSGRRVGVTKRKPKAKPLVQGKELRPKKACGTDSSRRQSGDPGGRGGAFGVPPHLAPHVSHLPRQPNQSRPRRLLPPSSLGAPIQGHDLGRWPGLMNNEYPRASPLAG